ncbi:MAG: biotin/lipoate A/B protein ligase family protein [Actinomycetota bacterium]|jgi:lipoate-protein ligase A|nr:biotin/lipoate A/B protein ligase family protein [Actinomycetota bacterium]
MTQEWRLILDGSEDGHWNMAIDRAVQLSKEKGDSPPSVRLYGWRRPTVTLGRFQDANDVDPGVLSREGIDVVRRFTGGRGVLHDDELTYSVVASAADGVPRGVSASYRHLCAALVEAYRELGVEAELTSRSRGERGSAACYLHATHADLSVGAAKLSGSAQVWQGGTVMQHGSFVVNRDIERESRVFRLDDVERSDLAANTATLADRLLTPPGEAALRAAVILGFERGLDIQLREGPITSSERGLAETLIPEVRVSLL